MVVKQKVTNKAATRYAYKPARRPGLLARRMGACCGCFCKCIHYEKIQDFRKGHLYSGAVHLVICAVALGIFIWRVVENDPKYKMNLYRYHTEWDKEKCSERGFNGTRLCLASTPQVIHNYEYALGVYAVLSPLFSLVGHAVQYLSGFRDGFGLQELAFYYGIKVIYWLEYTLSATSITLLVFYYSGEISLKNTVYTATISGLLMQLGLLSDLLRYMQTTAGSSSNPHGPEWTIPTTFADRWTRIIQFRTLVLGFAALVALWYWPFESLARYYDSSDRKLSENTMIALTCLTIVQCVLFSCFGILQAVSVLCCQRGDSGYGKELAWFNFLSILSKGFLCATYATVGAL